ncbi:hypothetical protein KMZ32_19790 [Phycicoccus sp. MAQZ13P-2]|uniref:MinD/ParA family ATP-binding protein n=1 Tax=Phycicoccus mangrovi TaxID=2840470 RepID=UPI001C0028C7|nr:hypothetical protein [Phycicoccus mangrovi]MBT9257182.1 hypothetical protein [Phycicoccus mangrovi]MBT9276320.1 hypothetical protein [Phycicoccus mangrovi]
MSVFVLCSAAGSPGVTTTALGLAMTWPRPVLLVEADPTGGSALLAGHFRGQVQPTASLVDLALELHPSGLDDAIPAVAMNVPGSRVSIVAGTRAHRQARALTSLWEPLASSLGRMDALGQDVIVDAGRLGLAGSPEPLLAAADGCLLVLRTDLVALAAARSWCSTLAGQFEARGDARALSLMAVGEGRPYSAREIANVLEHPVTASVAWDEKAAAVFSRGEPRPSRFETSGYVRSLQRAGESLRASAARAKDDLTGQAASAGALTRSRA